MTSQFFDLFETSLGWVGAVATSRGVKRLTLPEPRRGVVEETIGNEMFEAEHSPSRFLDLRNALERYFSGEVRDLGSVSVDLDGSAPFFAAAWAACRTIPPGETRTYRWLAAEAGSPGAIRAAGQAMARNRIPLVIPCHRVVRSDGTLGGFGGSVGLPLKRRLLALENATGWQDPHEVDR